MRRILGFGFSIPFVETITDLGLVMFSTVLAGSFFFISALNVDALTDSVFVINAFGVSVFLPD